MNAAVLFHIQLRMSYLISSTIKSHDFSENSWTFLKKNDILLDHVRRLFVLIFRNKSRMGYFFIKLDKYSATDSSFVNYVININYFQQNATQIKNRSFFNNVFFLNKLDIFFYITIIFFFYMKFVF